VVEGLIVKGSKEVEIVKIKGISRMDEGGCVRRVGVGKFQRLKCAVVEGLIVKGSKEVEIVKN
jgi:hypothetical protein